MSDTTLSRDDLEHTISELEAEMAEIKRERNAWKREVDLGNIDRDKWQEEATALTAALAARDETIRGLRGALDLLVKDVAGYPAFERPCYALDVARAALSQREG